MLRVKESPPRYRDSPSSRRSVKQIENSVHLLIPPEPSAECHRAIVAD